jgi:3-deoxy-manno-octulosonate cytidylyltransferase (CMP-KDO synthetase)
MRAVALIPARLGSTRLPGKMLADLGGRPLLWHVWQQVGKTTRFAGRYILTDAGEIRDAAEGWGAAVLMTSPDCQSGTERIVSVLDRIDAEFIVNVQGDEPLVDPGLLDALVERWRRTGDDLLTPVYRLRDAADLRNPDVVKVVRAADGRALYFSRSAVPCVRDLPLEAWPQAHPFWGHVGVYGYRRRVLAGYGSLPPSALEAAERLEQLRFLEAGYTIQTIEAAYRPVAVDTAEDLERVRQLVRQQA